MRSNGRSEEQKRDPIELVDDRDREGSQMRERRRARCGGDDGEAAREPKNERRRKKPRLPDEEVIPDEQRHGMPVRAHADPDLDPGNQPEERPKGRRKEPDPSGRERISDSVTQFAVPRATACSERR